MAPGDLPCDPAAPVVADEVEPIDPEGVGEAEHVPDEPVEAVLPRLGGPGPGRVTPLVGRDGAIPGRRQRRELVAPRVGRLREAVEEQDELAVVRTLDSGVEDETPDRQLEPPHASSRYPERLHGA